MVSKCHRPGSIDGVSFPLLGSTVNSVIASLHTVLVVKLHLDSLGLHIVGQPSTRKKKKKSFMVFLRTKVDSFRRKVGSDGMSEKGPPRYRSLVLWAFRSAIPTMCSTMPFPHITSSYIYRRLFTAMCRVEAQHLFLVTNYNQNHLSTRKIRWQHIEGRSQVLRWWPEEYIVRAVVGIDLQV